MAGRVQYTTLLCAGLIVAAPAHAQGTQDIQAANALVERVFSEVRGEAFGAAAEVYLGLLESADRPLAPEDQEVVRYHLRLMGMVVPAAERRRLGLEDTHPAPAMARPSGTSLVQWWRRQDPLPATENNERLEEHLFRAAYARRHYGSKEDPRGFDDRGEIYLRFGPARETSVKFKTPLLVLQPRAWRLPDSELWVYPEVHDDAHFLFVRNGRRQPFRLGTSTDLIPTNLRSGRRRTGLLLHVMEEVYAQLALGHPHYGSTYDAIADYRTLPSTMPAYLLAERALSQSRIDDDAHAAARRTTVPAARSTVTADADALDVSHRWARFLCDGGATCIELYWGLGPDALALRPRRLRHLRRQGHVPSRDYLLSAALVKRDSSFAFEDAEQRHYLVPSDQPGMPAVRTLAVKSAKALLHLAAQWDLKWTTTAEDGAVRPGHTLKLNVAELDSARALQSSGALEMSDIRPLRVAAPENLAAATPYPYRELTPATPLALYFEVYNLTFGADDLTHYTVAYRMDREGEEVRTASTSYVAEARTAREYVVLELGSIARPGTLTIAVRVTDDTSGTAVERSIEFDFRSVD